MSNYFSSKGQVWYTLDNGEKVLLNDLTVFATISDSWKSDVRTQLPYTIKDGDLPHMISFKLYGTVDYWWTVLLLNDIYDFDNQWPRSYDDLNTYIDNKYPGQSRTDVHHYIDGDGLVADLLAMKILYNVTADSDAIEQGGLEAVTIEEYEIAANEYKRQIKLIDPDYISAVQKEYELQMNSET